MNAINHAATALLINRKWPGVPMVLALVSVQFVECLWVILNLVGVEATFTEPQVRALNDIHLAHMPYSHSIASSVALSCVAWLLLSYGFKRPRWAMAIAIAISSHVVLDLATHVRDIPLAPGLLALPKLGSGLYGVPAVALVVETVYGIWCWWMFGGSKALLMVILAFNVGALSFYVPAIPGPEGWLAGHPKFFAAAIGVHIVAGWLAIGYFARSQWRLRRSDDRRDDAAAKPSSG